MSLEKNFIISVKGKRYQVLAFVKKAYDLSMEYEIPLTIELRKGSWEAVVHSIAEGAGKAVTEWIKDPKNWYTIGKWAWGVIGWIRKRNLTVTGVGQDTARGMALKILRDDYNLNCNLYEENGDIQGNPYEYQFKFKCDNNSEMHVYINKKTGIRRIFDPTNAIQNSRTIYPKPIRLKNKNK